MAFAGVPVTKQYLCELNGPGLGSGGSPKRIQWKHLVIWSHLLRKNYLFLVFYPDVITRFPGVGARKNKPDHNCSYHLPEQLQASTYTILFISQDSSEVGTVIMPIFQWRKRSLTWLCPLWTVLPAGEWQSQYLNPIPFASASKLYQLIVQLHSYTPSSH